MPFIINEDNALKAHLSGMTVTDENNSARPVKVWFSQPDKEIRAQSYPYVLIDLIDISQDQERSMSGLSELPYELEGQPILDPGTVRVTETPVPINLDYQITSYARHPRHDREIMSQMVRTRTPFKSGGIEVPEDNTIRPMFLTSFAKRDGTENGKRLFMNTFTVRVFSEITPSTLHDLYTVTNRTIVFDQPTINATVPN